MPTTVDYLLTAQQAIQAALASLLPPLPSTLSVKNGDSLQAAIDSAPDGSILNVQAGIYDGVVLRAGKGLTIQAVNAPLPGVRVGPSDLPNLVQLKPTAGSLPTNIITEPGSSHYTLIGLAPIPGRADVAMVVLGDDKAADPTLQPDNITIDRCLFLADPVSGGVRGIAANSRGLIVINSYFDYFWATQDAQAICGWNGPGPFTIQNNYLSASGENVMFGGGTSLNASMMPSNLTLKGNYLTKRLEWKGKTGCTVKDVFELKAMDGALIEGNIFEYSWVSGQVGFIIQLTPRGQSGKSPWNTVQNITFRNNIFRNAAAGINLLGADDLGPSGRLTNIKFDNNLMYGIDRTTYGSTGKLIQVVAGPKDVEFSNNTFVGVGLNSFLSFSGAPTDNLILQNNVLYEGSYGLIGSGQGVGAPSWNFYAPNGTFNNNLIAKGTSGRSITYPGTGNTVSQAGEDVVDSNYALVPTYSALPVGVNSSTLPKG